MRKLIILKLSTFILMYSINWSIADEGYLMIDPFSKNLKLLKNLEKICLSQAYIQLHP